MIRRRLFTLCSALSLLLCVAVCALWVRGCFAGDIFFREEFAGEGGSTVWTQGGEKGAPLIDQSVVTCSVSTLFLAVGFP